MDRLPPRRLNRADTALLLGAALLTLLPALTLLGSGGSFNGGYGVDVPDLMQYMGFIRDAGQHVLISNLFDVAPTRHVFLDPVFAVSGLVWRIGASIQVALLFWVPLAAAAVVFGFRAYVRRLVEGRAAFVVALALALFYLAPATALADWLGGSANLRFGTQVVGLEMFPGSYLWGGGPALAIAVMPGFLLAIERLLDPSRRAPGRSAAWYAAWAGAAGLLASWIHPWQGITLLLIIVGLALWGGLKRRYLALVGPALLTLLPLLYYAVLSRSDASWRSVSGANNFSHFGWWLWAGLAPLVLALPGYLVRPSDLQQRMLRLWPPAALVLYLGLDRTWFYHAFAGLSLPLAILAVQGWRRASLPRPVAALAVLALTAPGLVWITQQLVRTSGAHFFAPGEARALSFLAKAPGAGPVLAPAMPVGQAVPGFTGRSTYVGHDFWTPDYGSRAALAEALFDGHLSRAQALAAVRSSRAAFLVSDCRPGRVNLAPALGPEIRRVWRFGCATVYALAR